ncbi:MAG: nucleotidyltransferase domain-containing protein [Chloroflexi bacterium]|nr:nucleotidyltransferase domain-containing protein [Chloroflexota bacterium]
MFHTALSSPTKPLFPDLGGLENVFSKFADIQAVYLFGSVAEGRTHYESDIDLAVVPREDARPLNKLDILAELARAGFCSVDLVILDTKDIVLKHEAVRLNRLVYRTDDFDATAFFSKVIREYLDFLPYLQLFNEAYKEKVLG